ncbi:DUF2934 domain-containing protein [Hyalangium minutum]|uniref:DUF2934 domain-containing protein n=1 Tax=Hyalangium minutum TaxID=394096 RepID=A0A085W8A5_9BACT|nr:DUF2934 domain-containing protein [Hyalangium minutum]KFE63918.1 hypothetical protein DB31_2330 [Hyalangium minutum]
MARNTAKNPTTNEKETAKVATTPPAKAATNTAAPARTGPTHEQIARRAYEIFLARGGQPGNPEQDWSQAERELQLGRQ